jgi:hypothetical protein
MAALGFARTLRAERCRVLLGADTPQKRADAQLGFLPHQIRIGGNTPPLRGLGAAV